MDAARPHPSSRKRSRSPHDARRGHDHTKRHRSRSPPRSHRHTSSKPIAPIQLPFHARPLHQRDLATHRALFAHYFDVQKGRDIDALSETEVKGRWKSFVGKWNRGELAEGWYEPDAKRRAEERCVPWTAGSGELDQVVEDVGNASQGEEDDYGPVLPAGGTAASKRVGPAVPSLQDLQQRRELGEEAREAQLSDLRQERKLDRQVQKERLEDLAPRAEAGSRERQLEKKREVGAANRSFREAKEGGGVEEVGDKELMGGEEAGAEGFKAQVQARARVKNERELRKEEVLRVRAAEREERLEVQRRKEGKTMEMLKRLARENFG